MDQIALAEAHIIQNLFAKRKIRARIAVDGGLPAHFVAPFATVYRLQVDPKQKLTDVFAQAEDIASFINRFRRDNNLSPRQQVATVRIDRLNQTVEVSRIQRGTLHPSDVTWKPQPMTALLGQAQDFQGTFPIVWDLASPEQPHALLAGTTGSGKTNQLLQILVSLATVNDPGDLRITIIDAKPSPDLRSIELLPHVDEVARDNENALRLMRAFHYEMSRRYDSGVIDGPRRLLVIEELATITDIRDKPFREEFVNLLDDVARRCREAGMNLLVVTQKPTTEVLGSQLKSMLQVRIVGAVTSKDDSLTAVNMKAAGAEMLPGQGAMIYRLGRSMFTFQAPLIDDATAAFARVTGRPVEMQTQHRAQPQPQVMRHRDSVTGEVLEVVIRPDTTGYGPDMTRLSGGYRPDMDASAPVTAPDITGYNRLSAQNQPKTGKNLVSLPIGAFRPLEEHERAEVRRLARLPEYQHRGEPSLTQLCIHVYGSKQPNRMDEIKRALQAQPIPLRAAPTAQRRHMRVVGGDD